MNVIIDQRTGKTVAEFPDYIEAAIHRRDILRSDWRRHAICGVPA